MPICDNCQTAAYDTDPAYFVGLPRDQARSEMDFIALEMGADLPDHICDLTEDPDITEPCDCACHPTRPVMVT